MLRLTADGRILTVDRTRITADATLLAAGPVPVPLPTADRVVPTSDSTTLTVDADDPDRVPAGWPCARLPTAPPSVADRQSAPSADDLTPQIAGVLTPRGPAWGTDEAGDGRGAQPVMRQAWRALAAWVARQNADEWTLATQALPSAISYSLADWEAELGLPDPCGPGGQGFAARQTAVRARFMAQGGASPAYFVCLAASLGYDVTVEEPTQFLVDVSGVGPDPIAETWFRVDEGEIDADPVEGFVLAASGEDGDELGLDALTDTAFLVDDGLIDETPLEGYAPTPGGNVWQAWLVHARTPGETWFTIDEGEIDVDPIEGFVPLADLECLLRRHSPAHTDLYVSYALS